MGENERESAMLAAELARQAAGLSHYKDTDVYFCIQGNTGCVCLTVEENRSPAYQRREFLSNPDGLLQMLLDLQKMNRERRRLG